ncbi:uncharacterized protein PODANS_5_5400 [Podospora anserina S mat+]|uniref:Podospora anserina S mat+ genomic DNA chromosome 5, supercontig 6 n=1 Tax=Podospora anserina (strain S / ATCC MYA-4624 / DSM 980 / FGSC 10383) TaxID=515849 RepID=B2VL98_PODAN|nr:uncharacterized protein PODANS_5_5400 [Podospora anserina S mat+]CAP49214.1 unnamed protein product [Podospora anserina S mat+]CDP29518.1 Putative protein of unknown function [Podospora anserina S mat+]
MKKQGPSSDSTPAKSEQSQQCTALATTTTLPSLVMELG